MPNKKSAFSASGSKVITSDADWNAGAKTSNIQVSSNSITLSSTSYDLCANLSNITVDDYELFGPKENACDGDGGTFWNITGPETGTHYWMYDASSDPLYIGSVKLSTYGGAGIGSGPDPVRLEYSDNGTDWSTLSIINMVADNWNNPIVIDPPVSASYFRYVGYIVQGDGTDPNEFGLTEIEVSPASSGVHTSSSTQISGSADLESWDSFTTTEIDHNQNGGNAATTIEYQFRSGDGTAGDGGWSAWTAKQDYSGSSLDLSALSHDSTHRYLQVLTTLTTSNASFTPTLSDYTINYTRDGTCDTFDHINISPTTTSLETNTTTSFTAIAQDASHDTIAGAAVSYSATCGTIDSSGNYTAPATTGTCTITATSSCGGSVEATATITQPPVSPTCDDGIQNQDETDVDCGGVCGACPTSPTCFDGIKNQDETGTDCGGVCPACPISDDSDPTCSDGIKNQDETGVDCGGSCPACPVTPDPIICPYADSTLCDSNKCTNSLALLTPQGGETYHPNDVINITWRNNSSLVSLVEGWNIRYQISLSLDNGSTWDKIATNLSDINFPNQTTWQNLTSQSSWQSLMQQNTYNYTLPQDITASTHAKVKVTTYRTDQNPYNCSSYASAISKIFVIDSPNQPVDLCDSARLSFIKPLEMEINQNSQDTDSSFSATLYLSNQDIKNWPNLRYQFLTEFTSDSQTTSLNPGTSYALEPKDLGSFNDKGYLTIDHTKYPKPVDFTIMASDPNCQKTAVLKVTNLFTNRPDPQKQEIKYLKVNTPNGGERWYLERSYQPAWEYQLPDEVITNFQLSLSLNSGLTWQSLPNNKSLVAPANQHSQEQLTNQSLSWSIPNNTALITTKARLQLEALDRNHRIIASDLSDRDFIIANSLLGSFKTWSKDFIDDINQALALLSILTIGSVYLIPMLNNLFSLATFNEVIYGILTFGKKKRKGWGVIYDATTFLSLPYAKVMLLAADTNRLIEITTTDKNGRYGFIQAKGSFSIKVNKLGYDLSPIALLDRQALPYRDNYFGGVIEIDKESQQLISYNLPLTPNLETKHFVHNVNIFTSINSILIIANWPLIILGTIFSLLAAYISPNLFNFIIIILYIGIWLLQIVYLSSQKKAFGTVQDQRSKEALDLALVRVSDAESYKLIRTAASDQKGHYAMLLRQGRYLLQSQRSGYHQAKPLEVRVKAGLDTVTKTIDMIEGSHLTANQGFLDGRE